MERRKRSELIINLFLFLLTVCLTFSLTIRIFSFYTLSHINKVFFIGYLVLVIGLLLLRFVKPIIRENIAKSRKFLAGTGIAIILTVVIMFSLQYHIAPIRTTHTLQIANTSGSAVLTVKEIKLPGDAIVDFTIEYPSEELKNGELILQPGDIFNYSREMVGGLQVSLSAEGSNASGDIRWDGTIQNLVFTDSNTTNQLSLPGWTWGSPSLLYRLLGYISIVTDWVSVFSILFLISLIVIPDKTSDKAAMDNQEGANKLIPFTPSILINTGIILIAGLYYVIFSGRAEFVLLLFAIGILVLLRSLIQQQRKWTYGVVIGIVVIGIAANGYLWIRPTNELHQVILYRPFNTYEYLTDRIGAPNSTYLSIGYYRYLRESSLVITEPLKEELLLDPGRLEQLNKLRSFEIVNYDYQLSQEQYDQLLRISNWFIWPNRTGGDYYLLPSVSAAGDTYYFFSYDQHYFLLPIGFIDESGVVNVSFPD